MARLAREKISHDTFKDRIGRIFNPVFQAAVIGFLGHRYPNSLQVGHASPLGYLVSLDIDI
jgi:hypothetical protein